MGLGFRGKQIAALTIVAAVVALATSLMSAAILARGAIASTRTSADFVAQAFYHQARTALQTEGDLTAALTRDPALRSFAAAVVGYSPVTLYVAIVDTEDRILLHSDPKQEGGRLAAATSLAALSRRSALLQLWALAGGHGTLGVDLPFSVSGPAADGSIRVGVSTLLLRRQVLGILGRSALAAAFVVLAAFVASFYLAQRLLAPIERLRRELQQIDVGAGQPHLDLRDESDVGRIAEFFAAVGDRLRDASRASESAGWFEAMLGGLTDAVVIVDRDRRILGLNAAARPLLGVDQEAGRGRSIDELLPDGHPVRLIAGAALECSEGLPPRFASLHVDGRDVLHRFSTQLLRGEAGGVSGVMIAARDMDKLARLGSQLSYSQKLAALGKLTSGVAHEIKNPLNAMVMQVALLRRKVGEVGPEVRGHFDVLDEEIRRLDRVVQGFLTFTRPDELHLEIVRVEELLADVCRRASTRIQHGGVRLETDIAAGLPPVRGDSELLQQALLNLIINACEAMPEGGVLRLEGRPSPQGDVVLRVRDTGVGIPGEALPRIFHLYFSTKPDGSGVGLSMVYRIVQLHGGDITVDSAPGEGTTFTLSLPEAAA